MLVLLLEIIYPFLAYFEDCKLLLFFSDLCRRRAGDSDLGREEDTVTEQVRDIPETHHENSMDVE